jgi:hypothetical protein
MASNAVYLAECGFVVDAFDRSLVAVGHALARAHQLNGQLAIWKQDLVDYTPATEYEAVLCRGVLPFLDATEWDHAISTIQRATMRSGWNALSVFDDRLPIPHDLARMVRRVVRQGELQVMYREWQIVQCEPYVLCDEHPGGIRHRHSITRLLARRHPRRLYL